MTMKILCDLCRDNADTMLSMGYDRENIEKSVGTQQFDEVWAAYQLLAIKLPNSLVSSSQTFCSLFLQRVY